jgi:NAD(P)H-hydrate epimerase
MSEFSLTRKQVREVDRQAIERYGMTGLVLMENAGRGVADRLERLGIGGRVVICCGKGNNGGDGFVLARHLALRGHDVQVELWADPNELAGDAAANWRILKHCGVPLREWQGSWDRSMATPWNGSDWLVDALLGTGATGEPRSPIDQVIEAFNEQPARKMAIDLPSGLDCDTGLPARHTIRADHTCTFVAWKRGFLAATAAAHCGEIHVLDIGVPVTWITEIVDSAD